MERFHIEIAIVDSISLLDFESDRNLGSNSYRDFDLTTTIRFATPNRISLQIRRDLKPKSNLSVSLSSVTLLLEKISPPSWKLDHGVRYIVDKTECYNGSWCVPWWGFERFGNSESAGDDHIVHCGFASQTRRQWKVHLLWNLGSSNESGKLDHFCKKNFVILNATKIGV